MFHFVNYWGGCSRCLKRWLVDQADLCAAHNLLGRSTLSEWLETPDVTTLGPEFDPEADEAESDLDTQYMALMGAGVPVGSIA